MVRLSKRQLDKYVQQRLYELLFEMFSIKRSEKDFKNFFMSLFSSNERIMLIKRIGLIYLLIKGVTTSNICDILKISPSTLSKYSLILDKNKNAYDYFGKVVKKVKLVNILEEVINTLYGPGTPGVNWSDAWKTKNRILKRKEIGI